MAIKTVTELKEYFETADVPTEAQYIDVFDSLFNRSDLILQTEVEKLAPLTSTISGSGSVAIAAGSLVRHMVLLPSAGGAYTIGTTPGGTEYESGTLTGTTPYVFTYAEYTIAGKTIYFTGTFSVKVYVA